MNKNKTKNITYQGEKYQDLAKLCREENVSYDRVYEYFIKLDKSLEEAVQYARAHKKPVYIYNEKKYKTIEALSRDTGLSRDRLKKLLKSVKDGTVIDEIIENYKQQPHYNAGRFSFQGIEYRSLEDACRKLGISSKGVDHRIRRYGITREEAIKMQLKKGRNTFTYKGKPYSNIKECCKNHNIPYTSFIDFKNENPELSITEALDDYCKYRRGK